MSGVCQKECARCIGRIVDDLAAIDDGSERLEYLVELAKDVPCLKDEFKQDCFKVKGCMSNLWVVPEYKEGKCYFHCDGDAVIPKGIAFILTALHSGYSPEQVLALDLACVKKLGLERFLSPNRRNSVANVTDAIRTYAQQFLEETQCSGCDSPLKCLIEAPRRRSMEGETTPGQSA